MIEKPAQEVKAFAFDDIDRNATEVALLNDSIFYFG